MIVLTKKEEGIILWASAQFALQIAKISTKYWRYAGARVTIPTTSSNIIIAENFGLFT